METVVVNTADGARTPSAVAWGAIIAGGVGAAAVTAVLAALGAGLGLTTMSPWWHTGPSAAAIGAYALVWLVLTQWLSAALGGYLTGRLRYRWSLHNDEVIFRDTAHGFLAWALATVLTVMLFSSAVTATLSKGVDTAARVAHGRDGGPDATNPTDYFADELFRAPTAAPDATRDARAEAKRILMRDEAAGSVSADDRAYLTELVAARTGISATEATQRVDKVIAEADDAKTKAKEAADKARKTAATFAIISALSMVIGAFVAAVAAAFGGHLRDEDAV
jgi:hypothetical protein